MKTKQFYSIILLVILTLWCNGCMAQIMSYGTFNNDNWNAIQKGDTKEKVLAILGAPTDTRNITWGSRNEESWYWNYYLKTFDLRSTFRLRTYRVPAGHTIKMRSRVTFDIYGRVIEKERDLHVSTRRWNYYW